MYTSVQVTIFNTKKNKLAEMDVEIRSNQSDFTEWQTWSEEDASCFTCIFFNDYSDYFKLFEQDLCGMDLYYL